MKKYISLAVMLFATVLLVSACTVFAPASAPMAEYDLGRPLGIGASTSPVSLVSVVVTGQAGVNDTAMYYRDTTHPAQRSIYQHNRWASPPANMLEIALTRLLAANGEGHCHLQVRLNEFIVESNPNGSGQALVSVVLRVSGGEKKSLQRLVDVQVPMPKVSPAANAAAFRSAAEQLGQVTSNWLAGDAGSVCED